MFSRRLIALFLSSVIATTSFGLFAEDIKVNASSLPNGNYLKAANSVNDYVYDMYSVFLGREPASTDVSYWGNLLSNKKVTAAAVGYLIATSPEFTAGPASSSDGYFITKMYEGFYGRYCVTEELDYWKDLMANGMTREQVLSFFLSSDEFNALCANYGIIPGTRTSGRDALQESSTNLFVERLYSTILGRNSDKSGIKYWTDLLMNHQISGSSAGYSFIFSDEYRGKNKSDSEFINDLYTGFFGREADTSGVNYWISILNNKTSAYYCSDLDIFSGFCHSDEFIGICSSYGINVGAIPTSVVNCNARNNRAYFAVEDDITDFSGQTMFFASQSFRDAASSYCFNGSVSGNTFNTGTPVSFTISMNQRQKYPIRLYACAYQYNVSSNGTTRYIPRYIYEASYDENTGAYTFASSARGFDEGSYAIVFSTEHYGANTTFENACNNCLGAAVVRVTGSN